MEMTTPTTAAVEITVTKPAITPDVIARYLKAGKMIGLKDDVLKTLEEALTEILEEKGEDPKEEATETPAEEKSEDAEEVDAVPAKKNKLTDLFK